jgi:phosphoglycerate dehydrogenase-like enzyme
VRVWIPDYYERAGFEALPPGVELGVFPDEPESAEDLAEVEFAVPPYGRRGVLEVLPAMRRLRVLQADSAGVEWLVGHVPPGVVLCNARGVYDVATSEWVLTAILALTKDLPAGFERQRERRWEPWAADELAGRTVLIVGFGSIGAAVAERLEHFGVHLIRLARTARSGVLGRADLPRVLPDAHVVVLLTPLTDETRGLVDAAFLRSMRPGALLVNAGRGALVDTDALVESLSEGRIRAALDVTDPEPLPKDHPLWRASGALITPHLAGASTRAAERATAFIRQQVLRLLDGRPLENVVERG